ncbi:MAG: glycosyltransferase [Lachnospiraceae bacterium]|nr:glycosyltransferase [Lachnospiraceae bacterium]
MKILYLLSGTNMGGATLSFLTLLESVKSKGDKPHVVIPDSRKEFTSTLEKLGIPYSVIPIGFFCYPVDKGIQKIFYLRHLQQILTREIKNIRALNKIISQIKPDIIHTNVGPLFTGHFAAKQNKIPHIWHIREYGDLDFNLYPIPSKRAFHKKLRNDTAIFITKDLAKYNHAEESCQAHIIYNGVRRHDDISFIEKKEPYFLCASRVSPEKGHLEICHAFSEFHKKNPLYKLIILGDGNEAYVELLKEYCKANDLEKHVIFEGFQTNVKPYMTKAKALIVASPAEGFGRMTAEACFDGCLVIGKNSCGTKEILEQTGGFLYNTQQELIAKMENVASISDEEYKEKALQAQKKAQELFSIEEYTSKIYSIYNKILAPQI